ncbi:MAG: hypothetical protein K2Z80_23115 [Xanthobacteraceae bacterium]|nr:hypothetical protein [Xanthobacteraceae bacterium]
MTIRPLILMLGICSVTAQAASGADVRRTKFADGLLGTWALSQSACESIDSSNVLISEVQFSNSEGKCDVQWIVERPAAHGATYGVHANCSDPKQPDGARAADFIFWLQDKDRALIGKTFNDLKAYQRCTAK